MKVEDYKMRILFEMDKKDYVPDGSVYSRPSARAVIIKDGKIAMVYNKKYNYYKFPGGGIEADECMEDALIREVLEETGLCVIRDSIQEYGQVHRIQKGTKEDIFIQDNYYFLCSVKKDIEQQNLDKYEADEGFMLEFLKPQLAIDVNRKTILDDFTQVMLEREALVLELLIQEGYFEGSVKRFMKKLPSFCLLEPIIFMLRKSLSSLKLTGFQPGLDRNLEAK